MPDGGAEAAPLGPPDGELYAAAEAALAALGAAGATLATAESLTGGLIGAAVTAVPGASAVYRGGVVAYATAAKAGLLGVPADLLAREGAVHPDVAAAMAEGARSAFAADFGLAVTGVAGPEPQDGRPVGRVYAAVAFRTGVTSVDRLDLDGGRDGVRRGTAVLALRALTARATRTRPE